MFPACHLVKQPIVFASAPLWTYCGFNQVSEKKKGRCLLFVWWGGGAGEKPLAWWAPSKAPQFLLKKGHRHLLSTAWLGSTNIPESKVFISSKWMLYSRLHHVETCGKCLFPHVPGRKSGSQKMSVLGKPFTMYSSKSQAPNRTTLQQMAPFWTLYICVCVCVRTPQRLTFMETKKYLKMTMSKISNQSMFHPLSVGLHVGSCWIISVYPKFWGTFQCSNCPSHLENESSKTPNNSLLNFNGNHQCGTTEPHHDSISNTCTRKNRLTNPILNLCVRWVFHVFETILVGGFNPFEKY